MALLWITSELISYFPSYDNGRNDSQETTRTTLRQSLVQHKFWSTNHFLFQATFPVFIYETNTNSNLDNAIKNRPILLRAEHINNMILMIPTSGQDILKP
jgi:hypothetical protein